MRPAKSKKQKKFVKKRCPAGLRGEKEPVRPEKREKTGLGKKKELVRPAESEKQKKFVKKRCPAGLREEKELVRPAKFQKEEKRCRKY